MKKLSSFLLFTVFYCCLGAFSYAQLGVPPYMPWDVENASFLANEGIIVKQSTAAGYRLDDTITRAEAVGIALKIQGVELPSYRCKGYFSDVRNNDWICRAVEIGADHGLVTRANAKFRPQDRITRAEALAIVMKAGGIEIEECREVAGFCEEAYGTGIDSSVSWQHKLFIFAHFSLKMVQPEKITTSVEHSGGTAYQRTLHFYPNRNATRAEVFGFARNTLEYKTDSISSENATDDGLKYTNQKYGFQFLFDTGYKNIWTVEEKNINTDNFMIGAITDLSFSIKNAPNPEIFTIYVFTKKWWDANAEVENSGGNWLEGSAWIKGTNRDPSTSLGIFLGSNNQYAYTLSPNDQTCPDLGENGGGPLCTLTENKTDMVLKSFQILQ